MILQILQIVQKSYFSTKFVPVLVALIVTIALLIFKIKFILKMSKAKTDVNVFNNSFALCLSASGCSEDCYHNQ